MHAKLLVLALFGLVLTDAQSCIGFSKGTYSGDVTSQDECRTACETAEGFCCPDFKTSSGSNETYYKCSCVNNQQGTGDRRSLCEDDGYSAPCFPSDAQVVLASGVPARIDSLRHGDKILAAAADGSLYHDTVSRWSLAQPDARGAFVELTTETTTLRLTATHHLPVGSDMALKQAADVGVGELLWLASPASAASGALVARRVVAVDAALADGLHNPLLQRGGMPVVDGVATSFNSAPIVALDALAVPILEAACAATGTCTPLRRAVAAAECAAQHVLSARPVCKKLHYIDGAVVRAPPSAGLLAGLAVVALTAVMAGGVARARK